jgi:hypothetical protein
VTLAAERPSDVPDQQPSTTPESFGQSFADILMARRQFGIGIAEACE